MDLHAAERHRMVEEQLIPRGITAPAVLDAMRAVPRHVFVPPGLRASAYEDHPVPIARSQTISQPYIVALMAQGASLSPDDVVLEVGGGSGYAAAVFARIVKRVVSIERHRRLAEEAAVTLSGLGIGNVEVVFGDGMLGYPAEAPFDAVVAAAASPEIPFPWIEQLTIGGRLVMPLGPLRYGQDLIRGVRLADGALQLSSLGGVTFVPLIEGVGRE